MNLNNLKSNTVPELRSFAESKGIKLKAHANKAEIIAIINEKLEAEESKAAPAVQQAEEAAEPEKPAAAAVKTPRTRSTSPRAGKRSIAAAEPESVQPEEQAGVFTQTTEVLSERKTAERPRQSNDRRQQSRSNSRSNPQGRTNQAQRQPRRVPSPVPAERPAAQSEAVPSSPAETPVEEQNVETFPVKGVVSLQDEGYGFLRTENYSIGKHDVYISNFHVKHNRLREGDYIEGEAKVTAAGDRFPPLWKINTINTLPLGTPRPSKKFEELTPIFPNERIRLELMSDPKNISMRIIDLLAPIGKGQRGLIVSPPKAGKTTVLQSIANSISANNPEITLIVLLIDERPEEVTDFVDHTSAEVVYSTFDQPAEHHKEVAELTLARAQRLAECGKDVVILLDSITRLARAYNMVSESTGRTLTGGLDAGALYYPKHFFGAARNLREGGSLTIIATALVDTGSRMDDIIYEEFKGTGNMELHLDRKLSELRIFPAVDMLKSGTRKEELLLNASEREVAIAMRRRLSGAKSENTYDWILNTLNLTRSNSEFIRLFLQAIHKKVEE